MHIYNYSMYTQNYSSYNVCSMDTGKVLHFFLPVVDQLSETLSSSGLLL